LLALPSRLTMPQALPKEERIDRSTTIKRPEGSE
jgi:hypothetical protein